MPRTTRPRSRTPRGTRGAERDALSAATIDVAILYWRWLGEELPRYARAVSSELAALKHRRVGTSEAAVRIARLTQEYTKTLGDLPRHFLERAEGAAGARPAPGGRRRQGRVID